MQAEILAQVKRGETIESIHRGHLIVVEGDGKIVFSLGNPQTVTFFRSSAKPFQVLPVILSGASERFGFSEKEIALACGSHSGEPIHVETSALMLQKTGLGEKDLNCGSHLPFNEKIAEEMLKNNQTPTQLHNNCSGKHSAMLALAKHLQADISTYEKIENPVQQQILKTVSDFCEISPEEIKIAVDGCAAPNFALPLLQMAKSYLNLVNPPKNFDEKLRESAQKIVKAMMSYPFLVGGSERLDTLIMQALEGKIISKIGAEGVYLAGVLPSSKWKKGLGIAFKIEDGEDRRARPVVVVELLRQLGILDEKNEKLPKNLSPLPIKNRRGDIVGEVVPAFKLQAA